MDRSILHVDFNNFYASVECLYHPELRGKPVAVGGSEEQRRGIILAKNYEAKKYGVQTGQAIWEAKSVCRGLTVVSPHYDLYMQKSRQGRSILSRYSDRIEAMGADENWIDITGCERYLRKTPYETAEEIRGAMKEELGLTVSVGVSFNKVFAKLGSDMKKPDAVTEITRENFRDRVWPLPASDMIGVGRAMQKAFANFSIYTLGDLANFPLKYLEPKFGKTGTMLWMFANGMDNSEVSEKNAVIPVKSIGHSSNALTDIDNNADVWEFLLGLSLDVGKRLHDHEKYAYGVSVMARSSDLSWKIYQKKFSYPTQSAMKLATEAYSLFLQKHSWHGPLRALSVTAIYLDDDTCDRQTDLFSDPVKDERMEKLDSAVYKINSRFGRNTVMPAALIGNKKLPDESDVELVMPSTGFSYA